MGEIKLKPCPFCGGKAKVSKSSIDNYIVKCTYCPCDFGRIWFWKEEDVISAWNARISRISE